MAKPLEQKSKEVGLFPTKHPGSYTKDEMEAVKDTPEGLAGELVKLYKIVKMWVNEMVDSVS